MADLAFLKLNLFWLLCMVNLHFPKVFWLLNTKKVVTKLNFHYSSQGGWFGIFEIKNILSLLEVVNLYFKRILAWWISKKLLNSQELLERLNQIQLFGNFWNFWNFGNSGNFENFGFFFNFVNFGNFGRFGNFGNFWILIKSWKFCKFCKFLKFMPFLKFLKFL